MDKKPYEAPFRWRYWQLFVVVLVVFIIVIAIMFMTPAVVAIPTNLIHTL